MKAIVAFLDDMKSLLSEWEENKDCISSGINSTVQEFVAEFKYTTTLAFKNYNQAN